MTKKSNPNLTSDDVKPDDVKPDDCLKPRGNNPIDIGTMVDSLYPNMSKADPEF